MMKLSIVAIALVPLVAAHYTFPGLIVGGADTGDWIDVRMTNNHYSHAPVQNVQSADIRCYTSETGASATTITAGSTVGFRIDPQVQHPGPMLAYMAKAPSSVTGWDGSGKWFKIFEMPPTFPNGVITWPTNNLTRVSIPIPKSLPNGEYLLRVEHIALHSASQSGGAQFYLACAQVKVTGGGSGNPTPTVSFPGAYSASDPGILFQLYYPTPTAYVMPGPAVWRG